MIMIIVPRSLAGGIPPCWLRTGPAASSLCTLEITSTYTCIRIYQVHADLIEPAQTEPA